MKKILFLLCLSMMISNIASAMHTSATPSISVNTLYTDNVDRVHDNPEYDFITSVSPSISLDLLGKISGATFSYTPSWVHYDRTQDKDYWRHQANVNAYTQFGRRTKATIGGSYLQSEDPADNQFSNNQSVNNQLTDNTVRRGRSKYQTYATNANLDYQYGRQDHFGIGFNFGGTNNDDPTLEDSRYYRPTLKVDHWFTHEWGSAFSGYYERGQFDSSNGIPASDNYNRWYGEARILHAFNRRLTGNVQYSLDRVVYDGQTEDERTHGLSAGFEYLIERDLQLAMQLGYSILERPGRTNESGFYSDMNLTKTFQRGSLGLNAGSGYDYNYFGAENLGLNYYVAGGITASYQLYRRLSADAHANYRYTEYKDLVPQRHDDQFYAGCGLSFQLLRWLYVRTGYSYATVTSNYEVNNYIENRVFISLTARPSQPYRLGE